jgi:hypothetical protein
MSEEAIIRTAVVLGLAGTLVLGACAANPGGASPASAPASSRLLPGESIVIRTTMTIAATAGSEPIATGEVLAASTLGGSPFCAGGTIRDSHATLDPAVEPLGMIDRRITCPDGTVRLVLSPTVAAPGDSEGQTQAGTWIVASGTAAYEKIRGSGEMETVYGSTVDGPVRETLTGTVTR